MRNLHQIPVIGPFLSRSQFSEHLTEDMAVLLNNIQLTPQFCHLFHVEQNRTTAGNSHCRYLPLLQKIPQDHKLETKMILVCVTGFTKNTRTACKQQRRLTDDAVESLWDWDTGSTLGTLYTTTKNPRKIIKLLHVCFNGRVAWATPYMHICLLVTDWLMSQSNCV